MSLRLYNTLSRKKEAFEPIVPGKVNMYVCGPTVYNYISIGNSRPIVVFNMIRNYLKYLDYKVNLVQNITDIENKIINKANEEGVDYKVITERYIKAFNEDLKNLEIGGFDSMPLATEMISQITNAYVRIIFNPASSTTMDSNEIMDIYKKLRLRLWVLWFLGRVYKYWVLRPLFWIEAPLFITSPVEEET